MPREQLRGRVAGGLGALSGWMTMYAGAYEAAVGVALTPGSLNVRLDRPWVMDSPGIRLEADDVGVGIGLIAACVSGVPCWLLRTDKNNRGEGDHSLNVVELVAPLHLRTALRLADGDEVVIDILGNER